MGVVYLARDEQLDRDVAIKVLAPGILGDEEARARFRSEAQLLEPASLALLGVGLAALAGKLRRKSV